MRDVQTLIKMQKLYVDEQRRVLAARQREADALQAGILDLMSNLEAEKKNEAAKEEGGFILGAFIKKELHRKAEMEEALIAVNRKIEIEREKLSLLFEELKRYEIVEENWEEAQAAERQRKENLSYDEQAGTRHQRRQGEEN